MLSKINFTIFLCKNKLPEKRAFYAPSQLALLILNTIESRRLLCLEFQGLRGLCSSVPGASTPAQGKGKSAGDERENTPRAPWVVGMGVYTLHTHYTARAIVGRE